MPEKLTYIVDIDNTIFDSPSSDYYESKPRKENIDKINALYDAGHTIIYWTGRGARSGINWLELTKIQLSRAGAKYHTLWMGKPHYDVWIDDKAINEKDFFRKVI